ncbi:MAG: CYTH and CHAD domain-containing protein [Rhodococcus sp. (in: high G+C Gram-positive bacteria)]|uniref:CYTH and CHAD domain-containing protein n=1 Tax=Rhodococcus sp. TaxID=1831 RepID=UPI003BAFA788
MASSQREREDKYDVGLQFVLPDLSGLVPEGGRIEDRTVNLRSDYFDTAERDLLGQHLTLRRRSGETDEGWHLKVPADKARTEIRLPLTGESTVPDELAALVSGVALGKPLRTVATISTVRHTRRLYTSDNRLMAEVADDAVHSTVVGDGAVIGEWREVEVELGDAGNESLLTAIGQRLERLGATPSPYPSKLSRALSAEPPAAGGGEERTAASLLTEYLEAQAQAIVAGDVWLRRALDPIHSTRVGIRRFRSTLRVFATMFEPEAAAWFDTELAWYAGILGEVRDRQVQRERFAHALAELPDELVMGPVAARIETDLSAEQRRHLDEVMRTIDTDRYRTLLAALARWRTTPPLTDEAAGGRKAILARVRRAERKSATRVLSAAAGTDDEALHRARKAAKRARYAVELAAPLLGKKVAKKKTAKYKEMQEVLGEHQDGIVAMRTLRELGARAGTTPGENGFTFGVLYGLELEAAHKARADAARLVT